MDNPQARLIPGFERYTIDSEGTVYSTKGEPKTLHLTGEVITVLAYSQMINLAGKDQWFID